MPAGIILSMIYEFNIVPLAVIMCCFSMYMYSLAFSHTPRSGNDKAEKQRLVPLYTVVSKNKKMSFTEMQSTCMTTDWKLKGKGDTLHGGCIWLFCSFLGVKQKAWLHYQ